MIKNENGRRNSVRTDSERMEMLRDEIAQLPPAAKKLLEKTLMEMANQDDTLVAAMSEHRWLRKPVSVAQFLDDDFYLGLSAKTLYPKIRADLIDALSGHNYREMVLTGSIGYGKTTFLSFAISRMLYELTCLRSPQLAYGLSPGSEIVVAMISKSFICLEQL